MYLLAAHVAAWGPGGQALCLNAGQHQWRAVNGGKYNASARPALRRGEAGGDGNIGEPSPSMSLALTC